MLGNQAVRGDTVLPAPSSARKVARLLRLVWAGPREPWRRLGCHRDPFAAEPDPAEFFATPAAQKLYMSLLTALQIGDGGLFLVTGESGVGKSMLLRVVENTLRQAGERVSYRAGVDAADGQWQDELERIAADSGATRPILVVDGAELWDGQAIARLEQLFEARGDRARAVRLVIGGRPEIEQSLRRLIATVLGTKITFARLRLDPLDQAFVGDFVRYRLRQAGSRRAEPFPPAVLQRIAEQSGGNPRSILQRCIAEIGATEAPRGEPAEPAVPPAQPRHVDGRKRLAIGATAAAAAVVAIGALALLWPIGQASGPPQRIDVAKAASAPPAAAAEPVAVPALPDPPPAASLAAISPAAGAPPAAQALPVAVVYPQPPADGWLPPPAKSARPAVGADVARASLTAWMSVPAASTGAEAKLKPFDPPLPPVEIPALMPQPAPAAAPAVPVAAAVPAAPRLGAEEIAALMVRGDAYLDAGDLASARLFYERAAEAGDGPAALLLGQSFDPALLSRAGLRGDAAKAAHWYRRALALGAAEAGQRLKVLEGR